MSAPFLMVFTDPEDCSVEAALIHLAQRAGVPLEHMHSLVLHTGTLVALYSMFESLLPDDVSLDLARSVLVDRPETITYAQGVLEVAAAFLAKCKEVVG